MREPEPGSDSSVDGGGLRAVHLVVVALVAAAVVAAGLWWLDRRGAPTPPSGGGVTAVPEGTRTVTLYFAGADGPSLVPEDRRVAIGSDRVEQVTQVLDALLDGPTRSDAVSAVPEGTRVLAAFFDPDTGVLLVDFSAELVAAHPGGSAAEVYTIRSIVRTISENFPEVRGVQILVEGAQVGTIAGHVDAFEPFRVDEWR